LLIFQIIWCWSNKNHPITISIGLTQVKENDDEDTLFKRSDNLMYASKKNGKNRITID
jgi:PleD family two-component response regulator